MDFWALLKIVIWTIEIIRARPLRILELLVIICCCFANLNLTFEKQVFFSSLKAANDFKVLMLASNLSETDFTLKVRLILTSFAKNVFELSKKCHRAWPASLNHLYWKKRHLRKFCHFPAWEGSQIVPLCLLISRVEEKLLIFEIVNKSVVQSCTTMHLA